MKSISKSYSVPGLRLGVLASGDVDAIKAIKKGVSIWNINSFAEFYLQIEEKYHKDYLSSFEKIKKDKDVECLLCGCGHKIKKIGGDSDCIIF